MVELGQLEMSLVVACKGAPDGWLGAEFRGNSVNVSRGDELALYHLAAVLLEIHLKLDQVSCLEDSERMVSFSL
jgi:hypothetical protein